MSSASACTDDSSAATSGVLRGPVAEGDRQPAGCEAKWTPHAPVVPLRKILGGPLSRCGSGRPLGPSKENRGQGVGVWREPFTDLRVPMVCNLRRDGDHVVDAEPLHDRLHGSTGFGGPRAGAERQELPQDVGR